MKKLVVILNTLVLFTGCYNKALRAENAENILITVNSTDLVEAQNVSNNQLFDIQKIDSLKYFVSKEKANVQKVELKKNADLKQVKDILKDMIVWRKYGGGDLQPDKEYEDAITKIVCRNGKTYLYENYDELYFIAYYPQIDVLVCEGGHSSDYSINLTTGETTAIVGIPWYYVYSSTKKYLLNGYESGQECSYYFIQEKVNGQYQTAIDLFEEFRTNIDFRLCWILDAFWENDEVLNITTTVYPDERHEKLYYQIVLK
jgi:hypothetical protein